MDFFPFNYKAFDDNKDGRLTEEEFTTIAGSLISSLFLTFSHVCLDNATSENLPRKGLYDIHFVHHMSRTNPKFLIYQFNITQILSLVFKRLLIVIYL